MARFRDHSSVRAAPTPGRPLGASADWSARLPPPIVQRDTERVEIAPMVDRAVHAARLLGSDLGKRIGECPGRPVGTWPTARGWRRSVEGDGPVRRPFVGAGRRDAGRRRLGTSADWSARLLHRRARRTDLRGKSRWPAGCTTDQRRNDHPGRRPKWSAARAPVQRPAEEIRMRSITTLLTTFLGKTGLLEGDLDYHLLRASMVIIFLFFGYQKWWDYEAQTLIPFISNGPLISWMYPVFGIRGASWFLGVSEWLFGALIFIGFWNKTLGALGAAGSCLSFIMTLTIIPFMPDGWAASAGGFPAMTGNVPFLMKDVVLLAVSVYLLKQDAVRALVAARAGSVGGHASRGRARPDTVAA